MLTQDRRFRYWQQFDKEPHLFSALIPQSRRQGLNQGFAPKGCLYKCDFTATYSVFTRAEVEAVKLLSPNLKVIAAIRDPVARALSSLGRDRKYDANLMSVKGTSEYLRINAGMVRRENHYAKNLTTWKNVFGDNFVSFHFEEIEQQPEELLCRITRFLDIDDFKLPDDISRRRNVSSNWRNEIDVQNRLLLLKHWSSQPQPEYVEPTRYAAWKSDWENQIENIERNSRESVKEHWNLWWRSSAALIYHKFYSLARWGRGMYRARQLRRIGLLLKRID